MPSHANKLQILDFKKTWYIYYRKNFAQGFTLISLRKIMSCLVVSPAVQNLQKPHSQGKELYTRYIHFWNSLFLSENINILSRLQ